MISQEWVDCASWNRIYNIGDRDFCSSHELVEFNRYPSTYIVYVYIYIVYIEAFARATVN